jgi:3,4-dihydroxy 2-butanone 4-phosphate synthase/GTP cyclohydrolase II
VGPPFYTYNKEGLLNFKSAGHSIVSHPSTMVFTGIISICARALVGPETPNALGISLEAPFDIPVVVGESIAVNGVCLTVALIISPRDFVFELSEETRRCTAPIQNDERVHVERALRHGDLLGGHVVSGHVTGTGVLQELDLDSLEMVISFEENKHYRWRHKDSVAINGVSLTIARVEEGGRAIRIALISHTLKATCFRALVGRAVNVEPNLSGAGGEWDDDAHFMGLAVEESERARFTAPPNPWVGAVLVDSATKRILARAHHVRPGEPHAEAKIVKRNGDWSGCTLYVTLEPCHHHGRTPPCDAFLVGTRVERVVVGVLDPDERVAGQGVLFLRERGVRVDVLFDDRVRHSLRAYLWHRMHTQQPWVVCKLAVTLTHTYAGAITGPEALAHAHGERASSQQIVVGPLTDALDEHPQLTVRHGLEKRIDRQPERVVATRDDWNPSVPNASVVQILVEGGPMLQRALLEQGLVNEFVLYTATGKVGETCGADRWTLPNNVTFSLIEQRQFGNGDVMQRFLVGDSGKEADEITTTTTFSSSSLAEANEALARGGFVLVMDELGRENEGDLMCLASHASTAAMRFMKRHTTGMICVAMSPERAAQLELPPMAAKNTDPLGTNFTVSVDAVATSTGVSAADTALTVRALSGASGGSRPHDLQRPGHVFPLVAQLASGRRGHTEAGVVLAQGGEMAIAELYNDETGEMMRGPECAAFARLHRIPLLTTRDVLDGEHIPLPPLFFTPIWCAVPIGPHMWKLAIINSHRVLMRCDWDASNSHPFTLRIHSDCWTGDALGSLRCDCGEQLKRALELCTMIIFPPNHEGRGAGLEAKIRAYKVQDTQRVDTYRANVLVGHGEDERDYEGVPAILHCVWTAVGGGGGGGGDANIPRPHPPIRLLTNNQAKVGALTRAGFDVSVCPLTVSPNEHNKRYIDSKLERQSKMRGGPRLFIVQAQWYAQTYTTPLVDEILRLVKESAPDMRVAQLARVPGSWEILSEINELDCRPCDDIILCVGVVLRGETDHYDEIRDKVNAGLKDFIVQRRLRIINCVFACTTEAQVAARCLVGREKCVALGMAEAILHYYNKK